MCNSTEELCQASTQFLVCLRCFADLLHDSQDNVTSPNYIGGCERIFIPEHHKTFLCLDLWTTLNTVQENVIRGGQRDYSRRRPDGSRMPKSRAIKGIDEDMKLNKALWQMAEVLRTSGAQ
jgi:hypothetical protein